MMTRKPKTSGIRFTPQDQKIIESIRKKLGVDQTQIVRLALRALATKEGVTV